MVNKKALGSVFAIVVIILVIVGVIYFYMHKQNNQNSSNSNMANVGRVVFAVTDAASNIGSINKVMITVNNIQAHSTTEGWVTLSSQAKTYDLLELKSSGELALVSDSNVTVGDYDQVKMDVSKVVIVDSQGEHEAKLPSNELKINTDLKVKENSTATATFDFMADESIHITGNGKYILTPVVQVETRSDANAEVKSNSKVQISGGNVDKKEKVGMDVNGNIGVGLNIPQDSNVTLDDNGKISVGIGKGIGLGSNVKSNVNVGNVGGGY